MDNPNSNPEGTPVVPPVTPTDTPVETPVEKPTETPVVTEETPTDEQATPETKTETESGELPEKSEDTSKVSKVTSLVEDAGLDMVEVAKQVKATKGEVDIDVVIALKEKHGDAVASLIVDQIKALYETNQKAADKRDNEVYDQVKEAFKDITTDPDQTGESMWKELAEWTKTEVDGKPNVSPQHRKEINAMLAQGGLAAKLAVQELTSAFKESVGTSEFQDAELMEADTTAPVTQGGDISKSDYSRELNELLNKGHVYGESSEIAKLDARRSRSIRRGK